MPLIDLPLEELKRYPGKNPRPEDFDEYWTRALEELGRVDPKVELVPAAFQAPFAECFHLYFTGVRGARVLVLGELKGAIVASERIDLAPGATVEGSLSSNRVVLSDGTTFNGRIDMHQRTIAARVAHFKASQGTNV